MVIFTTTAENRCDPVFDRAIAWSKAHGVRGRKPLHALRKEYGSLINEKYDLVTAKKLLRHSSVAVPPRITLKTTSAVRPASGCY
jgi:hypothetical protein